MDPGEYERSFALEDRHWWFRSKRALVLALLRRYGRPGGRGLDVGCGTGAMLHAAGEAGTWFGIDVAWRALELSRKRGLTRLAAASATALPVRDGVLDVCLCLDLLYHRGVATETAALAECHRVLRPGGLLVVTDSAFECLRSPHDDAVHGARRYRRGEMTALLRAAGFRLLFASYHFGLVFPVVAAVRAWRRRRGDAAARGSDVGPLPAPLNAALLGVQALERGLLRLTPLPVGSSVVCVARKSAEPGR
jgi:ubiquinone/menaquinone biosynthesis C-methylase UbiE